MVYTRQKLLEPKISRAFVQTLYELVGKTETGFLVTFVVLRYGQDLPTNRKYRIVVFYDCLKKVLINCTAIVGMWD